VNIEMNDFVGNILKIRFTPAVRSCYQVLALTPMHAYLRRCCATLGTSDAETSLLSTAYCIE